HPWWLGNLWGGGGGGPVDSVDNPFAGMSLSGIPVGEGTVTLEITDQERWININSAYRNPILMESALSMAGAGASEASVITDALVDWVDRDNIPQAANGAESDFYLSLPQPFEAKNGVIDDLRELLLIQGVTPAIFWGPKWRVSAMGSGEDPRDTASMADGNDAGAGLSELFCTVSTGRINVNTAPEPVLRLLLGGDAARAREAVRLREELPARDVGDVARLLNGVSGVTAAGQLSVQSFTYSVRVTAQLGAARETFVGLISRSGARDYQTLSFRRD
ncbi:MAG: general secretion pathway protein GspK, partial [Verrucomicrobiae bacterium]|nr:general secretion pathway protein GspK [Verrucomicrobiae bacterium]